MDKKERDKYIAYIGQTYDNIQIWGQYEIMVDFLFDEFPKTNRRFEEIAQPLLSTISHAIELALKENIKFFYGYNLKKQITKFDNWTLLLKSHDLNLLADEFKIVFYRFHGQVKAAKNDKDRFNEFYQTLEQLNKILERNTETFRYSEKLDNNGNIIKPSIKRNKKIDLFEVREKFNSLKNLFVGAPNAMGIYSDYIDFKNNNPKYTKGKGKLYCQRLHYTPHFLERVKENLNRDMKQINENLWLDSSNSSNYEIQVWNNDIYIIEV